jgi:anaerobic dimethyl sulfoxide reductase subunit C (anchor subunit)
MELQWTLMIFTLFICLGAGIFAVQGFLAAMEKGNKIQSLCLAASLVAIIIGGTGSFLHLQHWERLFNGFGHLSSGITQELIAIVVFVVVMLLYFIVLKRSKDGQVPKWAGVSAVVFSVALVVIMSHSYNMAARPVWDTPLLWVYYIINAILFGGLAVAVISGLKKKGDSGGMQLAVRVSIIGGLLQAVITAAYAFYFTIASSTFTTVGYYFDPTHPTKEMIDPSGVFSSVFSGENALLFWGGVVVLGVLVPLALAFLARSADSRKVTLFAGIGLVCALLGGLAFRAIFYLLGFSVFVFY